MKKLISICVVVAMTMTFGCCTLEAPDGTLSQSFSNCFKTAQDRVCNAPVSVLNLADLALTLLKGVAEAYVPGSAEYTVFITAQNIKTTGCATLTNLNAMIDFFKSDKAAALETKMMLKAGPMKAVAIDVQPLIDWRDKK
jgi:hypothetical protein